MGDVVQISHARRKSRPRAETIAILTKIVDGTPVELIDVDELSSADRNRYFSGEFTDAPETGIAGASARGFRPLS